MKPRPAFILFALVFAFFVVNQSTAAVWPSSCGADSVQYKVKAGKKGNLPPAPETGKAQIVFVESLEGDFFPAPTARLGVDGTWAGAAKGNSYFAVSLEPGQHHLCASRQSSAQSEKDNIGTMDIHVEAGKTYFYEFKLTRSELGSPTMSGGGGLPGNPGNSNFSQRQKDTLDSASFKLLEEDQARSKLKAFSSASSVAK